MAEPRLESGMRMRPHAIHIEGRTLTSVTGVKDVASFNEAEVELMTEAGELTIEGLNLHITRLNLDEGQVVLEGEIVALEYAEAPEARGSVFSRLFK
ncbi:MAG: sporulation protein YabP [Clostridiaceae bacterium]|nr:sporulation protein YabP [Eubacteriales bacterium]